MSQKLISTSIWFRLYRTIVLNMCIFFLAVLKINQKKKKKGNKCHLVHFYHPLEEDGIIVMCFLSLYLPDIYYTYVCLVKHQQSQDSESYAWLSWVNALGLYGAFPESVFKSGEKSWVAFKSFFLMLSFLATDQLPSLPMQSFSPLSPYL